MIELTFNSQISKILEKKKINISSPIVPGTIYTLNSYHNVKEISRTETDGFSSSENIVLKINADTIPEEDLRAVSLLNDIKENDFLRVWVDKNDANDIGGLCFVCNTLRNKQTPIIIAYIPEYTDSDFSLLNVDYVPVDAERKMAYVLMFNLQKANTPEE